jgi:hypothetical protein
MVSGVYFVTSPPAKTASYQSVICIIWWGEGLQFRARERRVAHGPNLWQLIKYIPETTVRFHLRTEYNSPQEFSFRYPLYLCIAVKALRVIHRQDARKFDVVEQAAPRPVSHSSDHESHSWRVPRPLRHLSHPRYDRTMAERTIFVPA